MALSDLHKERIRTLASYLRDNVTPEHFDITTWWSNHRTGRIMFPGEFSEDVTAAAAEAVKDCGTAACVAGWAALLWPEEIGLFGRSVARKAGAFLGLSTEKAIDALFTPAGYGSDQARRRFTLKRAIETLERLADTGQVQWFKKDEPVEA